MYRAFKPMKPGSLRGSTFSLSAAAIGAGILSLPYVLKMSGWLLGSLLIMIGAITGYGSLMLLSIA
jgi:amino acid permease